MEITSKEERGKRLIGSAPSDICAGAGAASGVDKAFF